jgi:hypothetical protein
LFLPAFGVRVSMTCPSLNASPCQRKRFQVHGGLGDPRTDDEPQAGVVQVVQVGGREHAGVGDHNHGPEPVPALELPDHRKDRVLLGLVSLEAADLEREPVPAYEQPDHDLRHAVSSRR